MDNSEKSKISDSYDATINRVAMSQDNVETHGYYDVICHDKYGNLKWEERFFDNLITDNGRLHIADYMLSTAPAAQTIYVGLWQGITGGVPQQADTMLSHVTWLEVGNAHPPTYTVGTQIRATPTFSAATGTTTVTKTTPSPMVFLITSTGPDNINGAFLVMGGTTAIDNTSGLLFSAGAFSAGVKSVTLGDTLSASYTFRVT